jgi:DNA-directed RNA polymerase specialized sigma24 family protein
MQLLVRRQPGQSSEPSLESVFSAKYPWVLRWALHFAQNDRAIAEDLVQETFVRILSIRDTLTDLENIEPLLFTHLRFAYLTERRRGRSYAFQSLSVADFDTLAIGLRASGYLDQIEMQNELRGILSFLLWRRRSAKFASIFLLRFFHGFVPEEIAAICLITRRAVDLGLLRAREELRRHHADPSEFRLIRRGSPPEIKPLPLALSSDDFANDLLKTIFSFPCGMCPSTAQWQRHYDALNQRPLEGDLLAHLVSCKACLDKVAWVCGTAPPNGRSMGEAMGPSRRSTRSNRNTTHEKDILARTYARARERKREVFTHHPAGLVIVVDGQVVAVRDISSPRAILRVETRSINSLEMVEVFSEQNLLMLMLPVSQHPPQSPPELRNEVAMSDGRSLSLTLRFTGEGALIEAVYADPNFAIEAADADIRSITDFHGDGRQIEESKHPRLVDEGDVIREARPPRRAFLRRLAGQAMRTGPLIPITVALVLAAAGTWTVTRSQREQTRITDILHDSTREERNQRITHGPGVIHQQVEIRDAAHTMRRDLYRDIDGRRRPKAGAIDNVERALREKLAEADLDWNDPLSASGFDNWHDHVSREPDHMERTGANLLTVTTTPTSGPVVREALTLRLTDLHPVSRSFVFRDREAIEVAELFYEVMPWGPSTEDQFESLSRLPVLPPSHRSPLPEMSGPLHLSENEISVAKLQVLLAVQELAADTERLQIDRRVSGVVVTGIVETEARKQEIAGRLRMIPNVVADIHSYRDFDARPDTSSASNTVQAISVVAGRSPLDDYCEAGRVSRDRCQQLGYRHCSHARSQQSNSAG